jgi:nitrogen fixation-related uncharacterized protein
MEIFEHAHLSTFALPLVVCLIFAVAAIIGIAYSVRSGQFREAEQAKYRMLEDDENE